MYPINHYYMYPSNHYNMYPTNAGHVSKPDLLTAINNGTCAAAVMTAYDWDSVQNFQAANTGCYVVIEPPTAPMNIIRSSIGSFPCRLDYDVLCTSAVQVVWSTILNQM